MSSQNTLQEHDYKRNKTVKTNQLVDEFSGSESDDVELLCSPTQPLVISHFLRQVKKKKKKEDS